MKYFQKLAHWFLRKETGLQLLLIFATTATLTHQDLGQTPITADGLAAFASAPSVSGGGGLPCTPGYTDPLGLSNIVTTTASAGFPTTVKWFDGDFTSNGQFFLPDKTLDGSQFIKFDWGAGNALVITEWKFYQQNTTAQGTWKIQGSNDDSTYIDIGSSFSLGGVATQTITVTSGNTTAYRYYKFVGLSGTTSSGPWVYEMQPKYCKP